MAFYSGHSAALVLLGLDTTQSIGEAVDRGVAVGYLVGSVPAAVVFVAGVASLA